MCPRLSGVARLAGSIKGAAGKAMNGTGHEGDPADMTADAMRALFDLIVGAARPDQRENAETWLTDLLELATDSMSPDAKADVARQALQGLRPADGAGRRWEVSLGSRIVAAGSAQEAAEKARRRWAAEANDKYAVNDPNERYDVRPAPLSHGRWQAVYPHTPLPADLDYEDVEDDDY
jgi:hypothetical protein